MSYKHMLCALLLMAASSSAMAANDGAPTTDSGSPGQSGAVTPGPAGTATPAPTCRQASKPKRQLTAEEKARRKALRAEKAAMGITPVAKPHKPKLPLC
jgi:hypothetical protein